MDDHEFQQLLDFFELSREGYRKVRKGVKRRVRRHMDELGCRCIGDYLVLLETDASALDQCRRLMTVSISRFLRDRHLWDVLRSELLPDLIRKFPRCIRIWSAGCANGEEVYSFRMIWDMLRQENARLPELEVTATDINPECLQRAGDGIYSTSSLREVSDELRSAYFERVRGKHLFAVKTFLRHQIRWQEHDLFSDPPGSDFHIIFLRNNLLTYYQPHLQAKVFTIISGSLVTGGILVVGSHEKLPDGFSRFIRSAHDSHIYRKT